MPTLDINAPLPLSRYPCFEALRVVFGVFDEYTFVGYSVHISYANDIPNPPMSCVMLPEAEAWIVTVEAKPLIKSATVPSA